MAVTFTPKFGLPQWGNSATDGPTMAQFDAALLVLDQQGAKDQQGVTGSRPAAGVIGRYYWDTTVNALYRDNGTAWNITTQYAVDMKVRNFVTTSVPLTVNGLASTTSHLAEFQVNGATRVTIDNTGVVTVANADTHSTVKLGGAVMAGEFHSGETGASARVITARADSTFTGTYIQDWLNQAGNPMVTFGTDGDIITQGDVFAVGAISSTNGLATSGNLFAAGTAHVVGNTQLDGNLTVNGVFSGPGSILPGMVMPYLGPGLIGSGWLDCDGTAVSRSTYAALFAAIGTTYGVGNGTTTFNLPNFTNKFLAGFGPGSTGGGEQHTHPLSDDGQALVDLGTIGSSVIVQDRVGSISWLPTHKAFFDTPIVAGDITFGTGSALTGDTDAADTPLPPYMGVNWAIKF